MCAQNSLAFCCAKLVGLLPDPPARDLGASPRVLLSVWTGESPCRGGSAAPATQFPLCGIGVTYHQPSIPARRDTPPGRRATAPAAGHCQVELFVTAMGVATDSLPNWTASTYMPLKAVLEAVTVNSMVSPLLTPVALGRVTFFTAETETSGVQERDSGCTPPAD